MKNSNDALTSGSNFSNLKITKIPTGLLLEYLGVIFITCLLTGFYFRSIHLTLPLRYEGDFLSHIAFVKESWNANGPWFTNFDLGAPIGLTLLDYPTSDNLHYLGMYLLHFIFNDVVVVVNIYFIATFLFSAVIAYYVLKNFDLPYFIALPGALAFTFLPYHILRAGHLFLASYFLIPLILLLTYKIVAGEITFFQQFSPHQPLAIIPLLLKNKVFWIAFIFCLVYCAAGIYYTFFAVYIITLLALKFLLTKNYQKSFNLFILSGILCLSILVNLAPAIGYRLIQGTPSASVAVRPPTNAEIYGLKIIQMLLPASIHHIDYFRNLATRYADIFPLVNENSSSSLGMIGSTGFLLALFFLFSEKRKSTLDDFIRFTNLICLLLGTIGGFGALIAYFITPQIRGYNRISLYIAFIAIIQFSLLVKELYLRYVAPNRKQIFQYGVIALLMGLVIFDQIWVVFPFNQEPFIKNYESDKVLIKEIETLMPDGAMIFQLPFIDFPEAPPPSGLGTYDHFRAYIHSTKLKWSYGAMKGRESAEWYEATAKLPIEQMVEALSVSGFSGIYIARDGYSEQDRVKVENSLKAILGVKPIISNNDKLAFYDLRKYQQALKARLGAQEWENLEEIYASVVIFKGEFSYLETKDNTNRRWSGDHGLLSVLNFSKDTMTISFDVISATGAEANLIIKSKTWNETIKISGTPTHIERTITVSQEPMNIQFNSDAPRYKPPKGGKRELVFRIDNFHIGK